MTRKSKILKLREKKTQKNENSNENITSISLFNLFLLENQRITISSLSSSIITEELFQSFSNYLLQYFQINTSSIPSSSSSSSSTTLSTTLPTSTTNTTTTTNSMKKDISSGLIIHYFSEIYLSLFQLHPTLSIWKKDIHLQSNLPSWYLQIKQFLLNQLKLNLSIIEEKIQSNNSSLPTSIPTPTIEPFDRSLLKSITKRYLKMNTKEAIENRFENVFLWLCCGR